jgi:2-polyprenyl-3-methyl-5-hydroxy-6-metoxy-1,4-benzoquinol methylase
MVKQSLNTYNVTENLSIQLVEIPKIQNVPKCNYCGKSKGNFWDETWPSALALSKYLAKELPLKRLEDCRALVIGCGIGLEGLVLAKLGANVTFLDHIPEALQLVSQNCLLNEIESFQTICCCLKDSKKVQNIGKYDLVIGSDILYYFLYIGEWVWMESLLKTTLKTNGWALFSDPIRFNETDFFRGLANASFRVKWTNSRWGSIDKKIMIYCVERHEVQ